MSLKETGFTFAEKLTASGEIQEDGEEDDLRCLNQPGDRFIWDGARADWYHEESWPLDKRSKMWYLCHGQIAAVTEERGLPNFLVIPREHLNEEDLPGYEPLDGNAHLAIALSQGERHRPKSRSQVGNA